MTVSDLRLKETYKLVHVSGILCIGCILFISTIANVPESSPWVVPGLIAQLVMIATFIYSVWLAVKLVSANTQRVSSVNKLIAFIYPLSALLLGVALKPIQ